MTAPSRRRERIRRALRTLEQQKYDEGYFHRHHWLEDHIGPQNDGTIGYDDPGHKRRFAFLASLISQQFSFDSFLDVGCGPGYMLNEVLKLGIPAWGFDVSHAGIQASVSIPRTQLLQASIHAIPFRNRSIDLVFCSDVLEHIPILDIEDSLCELARVTRKTLVATINLNNPCKFHPTILSRDSWDALFQLTGAVVPNEGTRRVIQECCKTHHPEYEWFIFDVSKPRK